MTNKIKTIQFLDACDIPCDLYGDIEDLHPEFPFHYSSDIVWVEDNGNKFSEWLKEEGFDFNGKSDARIAVQGT